MSTFTQNFARELARLNPSQRQAVETLDGPVLVVAGPGTGKTQVLALRIANLINPNGGGVDPRNILALTFTNAAAVNMRDRLARLIGPEALQVTFGTFHEFCQSIITDHPEYFSFGSDSQPLDDLTRYRLLREIIDTLDLTSLRPAGDRYHYLPSITSAIEKLKRENVSVDAYNQLVAAAEITTEQELAEEYRRTGRCKPRKQVINKLQKTLRQQQELGQIYRLYQEKLQALGRFDFNDMLLSVIDALDTNPDLLSDYQEKYQRILIDEYQDTNNAQSKIAEKLAEHWQEQADVFVVGDPQQSIYRFQGANLENFLQFQKRFPSATKITLEQGYRCTNSTYYLAHQLACRTISEQNAWLAEKPLINECQGQGRPLICTPCDNQQTEILTIIKRIQNLLKEGKKYSDIAIIYRKNKEAPPIQTMLAAFNIPYTIEGGRNILTADHVQQLISWLQVINSLENGREASNTLYQLLWLPATKLPQTEILTFNQLCYQAKVALSDVLVNPQHQVWLDWQAAGLPPSRLTVWKEWGRRLLDFKAQALTDRVSRLIQTVLTETGFLAWAKTQPQSLQILTDWYALEHQAIAWEEADPTFDLARFLDNIKLMNSHHLTISGEIFGGVRNAVTLTTAHKAKGCEWTDVFVYGFNRGVWDETKDNRTLKLPDGIITLQKNLDEETEKTAEEERLVYVALTRAKQQNFVSWHNNVVTESGIEPKQPAALAYWLQKQPELAVTEEVTLTEQELAVSSEKLLTPAAPYQFDEAAKTWLANRVKKLTLSATMLNDYLRQPQQFLERHILQCPVSASTEQQEFGNSIHRSLEKAVRASLSGQPLWSLDQLTSYFTEEFTHKNLDEATTKIWLDKGQKYLHSYYPQLTNVQPLAVEHHFGGLSPLMVGGVPIGGKIDRIDLLDPATRVAQVVDYKTGRVPAISDLQGTTKKAQNQQSPREKTLPPALSTPELRQLHFYKLLCDTDPSFGYQVTSGQLVYLRGHNDNLNDDLAEIKPYNFALTDDNVQALKELIVEVWSEIQQLKFLDNQDETTS